MTFYTSKVNAYVEKTDKEHSYTYVQSGDDMHEAVCTKCGKHEALEAHTYDGTTHLCKCGKTDPAISYVSEVNVAEKQVSSYTRIWFKSKKTTKYQYTISTVTENVSVSKVEYSKDSESWTEGKSFKSDAKLGIFYIRITDSNGAVTNWKYDNGEVRQMID